MAQKKKEKKKGRKGTRRENSRIIFEIRQVRSATTDSLPSIVFCRIFLPFPPPSPPRPVSVRTGKIKVRLSSQYCERGTNEIRAASGRISSFELARNSSRLYLVGGKRPPPKGEHNESLRIIKTFPVFFTSYTQGINKIWSREKKILELANLKFLSKIRSDIYIIWYFICLFISFICSEDI